MLCRFVPTEGRVSPAGCTMYLLLSEALRIMLGRRYLMIFFSLSLGFDL